MAHQGRTPKTGSMTQASTTQASTTDTTRIHRSTAPSAHADPASAGGPAGRADAARHPRGYREQWRAVPAGIAYLISAMVLGIVSFAVLLSLTLTGISTLIIAVGIFILVGALLAAGAFGTAERNLLQMTGRPPIDPPAQVRPDLAGSPWRRAWARLRDPHGWMALLHGVVVAFPLGLLVGILGLTWAGVALGGLTAPIWYAVIPDQGYVWGNDVARVIPIFEPLGGRGTEATLQAVTGLLFAITLPWVTAALVRLKYQVVEAMLGRWPSDDLREEVASLAASRGAAVQAEDRSVRRLERDLHDGPQQRLMRLQMDLATLERRIEDGGLAGDPEQARRLVAEARGQGQAVLDELRALVGGMAPPLLQDRGLGPALQALAARNPVPAKADIHLDEGDRLPGEVERNAYFIVAELLTNTVKHSGASAVTVRAFRHTPEPGAPELVVQVGDDGTGGAHHVTGHGLEGLAERVHGLRGEWWVESPAGGPSLITAALPLR